MGDFLGDSVNDNSTYFFRSHMQLSLGFGMSNSLLLIALPVSMRFGVLIYNENILQLDL